MVPGKLSDAGVSVSEGGAAPVPVSATVCAPLLVVRVSVPEAGPVCLGAKVTVSWHALLAAMDAPQALLARAKGAVTATLLTGTALVPVFCTVT